MKPELMIEELHEIARQLGVTIRYDRGDFEGGYCILKDQKLLLVNRRLLPARKASVLATAMSEIGLENVFVKPAIREFIEDEVAKADRSFR
jgi:murein endopeptidase